LLEISRYRRIAHVDLYGGEVGLLEPAYWDELWRVLRVFYRERVNVVTNLSVAHPYFEREDVDLSVSWDYVARPRFEATLANLRALKRGVHVLVLASRRLLDLDAAELERFMRILDETPQVESVEIKPYSLNPHHPQPVRYRETETWIRRWIERAPGFRFELVNADLVARSLRREKRSWSDDHLYIDPSGALAVLDFDDEGRERFSRLASFDAYVDWTEREKRLIREHPTCSRCPHLGHCLSEHLQPVHADPGDSCNGLRGLLDDPPELCR